MARRLQVWVWVRIEIRNAFELSFYGKFFGIHLKKFVASIFDGFKLLFFPGGQNLFLIDDVLLSKRVVMILLCFKIIISYDTEVFLGFSVQFLLLRFETLVWLKGLSVGLGKFLKSFLLRSAGLSLKVQFYHFLRARSRKLLNNPFFWF